jgi:hypothetical protein
MTTFILLSESKEKPLVDLVFVFGSTGKKAVTWFEKEREIAKEMIDNEREKDTLYGTIIYGKDVSVKSKFKDMQDKVQVKTFIDGLSWESDGEKMDHALRETDKLFKEHGRPKARKITVVFVTGTADATTNGLKKAAKKLNDNEVKIIVVKLGTDPDDGVLEAITPKKNIVKVNESDDPERSAEVVDEQRMKGNRIISFEYLAVGKAKI